MNTKIKKIICYLVAATLIITVVFLAASKMKTKNKDTETEPQTAVSEELVTENTEEIEKVEIYRAESTPQTAEIGEAIESPHAILIDEQAKTIIAQKNPYEKMYPASMTKVMTVLVACENISPEDLDKTAKAEEKVDFSNVKIEPIFKEMVDFETFAKSDFRAVKILACEAVPKSKKLLKFTLDDGERKDRVILSGIHEYYEPEELVGKTAIAIVNLPPRKMMGIDSEGMLISAVHEEDGHEGLNLLMVDDHIPAGAKLY